MDYTFQFSEVFDELPYLLGGALITLQIAFITFWAGAVIGIFGAIAKVYGGALSRRVTTIYVSFFTNTPALVQVFLLYYALPDAGVLLAPMAAVLIGLTVMVSAAEVPEKFSMLVIPEPPATNVASPVTDASLARVTVTPEDKALRSSVSLPAPASRLPLKAPVPLNAKVSPPMPPVIFSNEVKVIAAPPVVVPPLADEIL